MASYLLSQASVTNAMNMSITMISFLSPVFVLPGTTMEAQYCTVALLYNSIIMLILR